MHVTCRSAAAVLKLGEEEPDGVTKTMRGRWRRAPLEVALWEPGTSVCKDGEEDRHIFWIILNLEKDHNPFT